MRPLRFSSLQEREGRWWWEDTAAKECGLHSGNIKAGEEGANGQAKAEDLWQTGAVEALSKDRISAMAGGACDKDTLVVLYAPWCQ